MKESKTRYSQPGEWVNRSGLPVLRGSVRRIVVVKPDHIGDLLIASKAFFLLRHFFPDALIELVCGPWNTELARQLGIFDCVHGVNLFHELSGHQSHAEIARVARRNGMRSLADLNLGRFDIAVDMRYDLDSRAALLMLDAEVYAGFGSVKTFPYLDIAIPMASDDGGRSGALEVFFGSQSFVRIDHESDLKLEGMTDEGTGTLAPERHFVDIDFTIIGSKSPDDCKTVLNDMRPLGIALREVTVASADAQGGVQAQSISYKVGDSGLSLRSGWTEPESWGVWATGDRAKLRVALPQSFGKRLLLSFDLLGHVNVNNRVVTCGAQAGEGGPSAAAEFRYPKNANKLTIEVPSSESRVRMASSPFLLAPGKYTALLRLYIPVDVTPDMVLRFSLKGIESSATFMLRGATTPELQRGLSQITVEFYLEHSPEALTFLVETDNGPAFRGSRVEFCSAKCIEKRKTNIPPAHMESRACMLAMQLAIEFSKISPFNFDAGPQRLTSKTFSNIVVGNDGTKDIVATLGELRNEGWCLVGVSLACNSEIRKWPLPYFIELCRSLLAMGKVKIFFIGATSDASEASVACKQLHLSSASTVLCGKTSLTDLAPVLAGLDLFIGNNTGTTHYAGKVGVRTIGIYSGTNHPREWGPIGENASWITRDEECAPCFLTLLKECRFGHVCLHDLMPEDVLKVVRPEVLSVLTSRAIAPQILGHAPIPE